MTENGSPEFLRSAAAEERSGLERRVLYRLVRQGQIIGFRPGGTHWKFDAASIDDYVRRVRLQDQQEQAS